MNLVPLDVKRAWGELDVGRGGCVMLRFPFRFLIRRGRGWGREGG